MLSWGRKKNYRGYGGWAPYVPVAERKKQAAREVASMNKKGEKTTPVIIQGRTIATTFWGKAWCDNLESYMDYENRLPRGRTYARNGSIVDLKITAGKIKAKVIGSSLYTVEINIKPIEKERWQGVIKNCSGKIASLMELIQGKLSKGVMECVTSQNSGLFPSPQQISLKCSCPDWADMCKHVAAVMYGVGHRLDQQPELLFLMRQVDHLELIAKASTSGTIDKTAKGSVLKTNDLGSMFGIEMDEEPLAEVQDKPENDPDSSIRKKLAKKVVVKKRLKTKKAAPKKVRAAKKLRKSKVSIVKKKKKSVRRKKTSVSARKRLRESSSM